MTRIAEMANCIHCLYLRFMQDEFLHTQNNVGIEIECGKVKFSETYSKDGGRTLFGLELSPCRMEMAFRRADSCGAFVDTNG